MQLGICPCAREKKKIPLASEISLKREEGEKSTRARPNYEALCLFSAVGWEGIRAALLSRLFNMPQ